MASFIDDHMDDLATPMTPPSTSKAFFSQRKSFKAVLDHPVLKELELFFYDRRIPLSIIDLRDYLKQIEGVVEEKVLVDLYRTQKLVLVRPDLYVNW